MNCTRCKCNVCGNMHNCEMVLDRIIERDQSNKNCDEITECSEYNPYKDYTRYKEWTCEIRNFMKGGEAIHVARTVGLREDKNIECNNG